MKKLTDIKNLPYLAGIVQALVFAFAGSAFFGEWGWIPGGGVGLVVSLAMAVGSSRLAEVPQKRKALAYMGLAALVLVSPITITLSLYKTHGIIGSIAWAMSVDLAVILAGFVAGKSLISAEQKPAAAQNRSAKGSGKSKPLSKKSKLSAAYPCPFAANGCEVTKETQNAINAHAGKCKHKPMAADKTIFISDKKEDVKK